MADNGREALSLVESYPDGIDMLVTDVVMPEVRGTEVVERSVKCRPNMQVIYISGYLDAGITDSTAGFLQKPFGMQELGAKIRTALDMSRAGAT